MFWIFFFNFFNECFIFLFFIRSTLHAETWNSTTSNSFHMHSSWSDYWSWTGYLFWKTNFTNASCVHYEWSIVCILYVKNLITQSCRKVNGVLTDGNVYYFLRLKKNALHYSGALSRNASFQRIFTLMQVALKGKSFWVAEKKHNKVTKSDEKPKVQDYPTEKPSSKTPTTSQTTNSPIASIPPRNVPPQSKPSLFAALPSGQSYEAVSFSR